MKMELVLSPTRHFINSFVSLFQNLEIEDDYCGTSDSNSYFASETPIESEAALVFPPNTNLTAIAVSQTQEYTVAFVGNSKGQIIKVIVFIF